MILSYSRVLHDSPKEIWEAVKSRNLGDEHVKEARLQTLMNEFERLRMKDTDSIDIFSGKISELASKSAALGQTLEGHQMGAQDQENCGCNYQEVQIMTCSKWISTRTCARTCAWS